MADKKKFKKKTIKEEYGESGGFGSYSESNGGGTPRGGIYGGKSGRVGWDSRKNSESMPAGAHRESQPRTSDGKFTYNSVNGKELAPSSDPTRGKTVNPLLTGGENGISIDTVEQQFSQEYGSYWNKYKDKWYRKGGEIVGKDFKVHIAAESIWNIAKDKFDKVKGEFVKEKGSFDETKKGRASVEEKAAKQKAYLTDDEAAVIDSKGGIKLKPGVTPASIVAPVSTKPYRPKSSTVAPSPTPVAPQQPVATQSVSDIANADYQPKNSDEDYEEVKRVMKAGGFTDDDIDAFDKMSPKQKDAFIDQYFDVDNE